MSHTSPCSSRWTRIFEPGSCENTPAPSSTDQLTELLYLVDPMRFAIESYRLHSKPENGLRFLERVLAGNELVH